MEKLLAAYASNPTIENARKVAAYNARHMMAACMLLPSQTAVLNAALLACGKVQS